MYKYYESEGIYQIQIVDGLNFNANKYFDITENNWKLNIFNKNNPKTKSISTKTN